MKNVKVAFFQTNATVGDLEGNSELILKAAKAAAAAGACVLLTPEMSLCGYPPEDWSGRREFVAACETALCRLAGALAAYPGLAVLAGAPLLRDGRVYNAAVLLRNGQIEGVYLKHRLPEYGVFDEPRFFSEGREPFVFLSDGVKFGVIVCEDGWYPEPAAEAVKSGAQVILSLNASPFSRGKIPERLAAVKKNVVSHGVPCVYANLVGGQDDYVFDGGSFVMLPSGEEAVRLCEFESGLGFAEFDDKGEFSGGSGLEHREEEDAAVYEALKLAVRDYVEKNRFPGIVLGLSGGVDSALVLAIAADALGPERCRAVMMPSDYTASISLEDAELLAGNLGVRYDVIPVKQVFASYMKLLTPYFEGRGWDATEENLQARIRGMILMALSNKTGALVLTTGNKSEGAVGYSTLYGDLAGGFAVIRDVLKTRVYELCRLRNRKSEVIPERILTRAPSAELRDNQKDEDSLPPYAVLDQVIECYVEKKQSPQEIERLPGMKPEEVRRIISLVHRAEYKRRQSPVGPRISPIGFGRDWRYPITGKVVR